MENEKEWEISPEWQMLLTRYQHLNRVAKKGEIVFAGSSLMEQFPVNELMTSLGISGCVYNRGIGGYTTDDLLRTMDTCIFDLEPRKLFINIGTNDIGAGRVESLKQNYREILRQVRERLPQTQIYLLAYYPCNPQGLRATEEERAQAFRYRTNEAIRACNRWVEELAQEMGCVYLDLNEPLLDAEGQLKLELTMDGVHMYPDAYVPILEQLAPWLD